jgi:enoyl-CoA hydratase/carnithine racemase
MARTLTKPYALAVKEQTMKYETVLVEAEEISAITLNRPEKRNALSEKMIAEIVDALSCLNKEKDVKVIIIKGAGQGFCAGADLSAMANFADVMDNLEAKQQIRNLLIALRKCDKVTISQLHGFALAGGFGFGLSADLVTASDDCRLGMPEIRRGLGPMNIMNPLNQYMPRRKLLEMVFTGNMVSPQDAEKWGLVNYVLPSDQLEGFTRKLAEQIACHSASALKLCKAAFYNMQDMDFLTAFEYLTDRLLINSLTEDAREGVAAFFEKREPVWKNK